MSNNISELRSNNNSTRTARAKFVHDALKAERWSIRQAALAIGINNTSLGDRMRGLTPFFAEDLEAIARLLKVEPAEFYAAYLRAGTSDEVGPTGIEPMTSTVLTHRFAPILRFPIERTKRPRAAQLTA